MRVEGTLPTGERTLFCGVIGDKIGYAKNWINNANRFDLYAKENTFDVIYINGDHNLPTAFTVDEDGEIVRSPENPPDRTWILEPDVWRRFRTVKTDHR